MPGRPGGVLLAEKGQWVGVGALSLPEDQRASLVGLIERYGQRHSSGTITIPADCIEALVHYTSRTPTHGRLREAFVVSIEPPGESKRADPDRASMLTAPVSDSSTAASIL
jgi:hypothetical protein